MQHIHQKNDRRHYLRFEVDLPIEIIITNNYSLRVKALDMSMSGIHFLCDRWDAKQILPDGAHSHIMRAKPLQATVRFRLPSHRDKKLNVFSEIIEATRLSENSYRINLKFVSFWGDSRRRLEGFLEELKQHGASA